MGHVRALLVQQQAGAQCLSVAAWRNAGVEVGEAGGIQGSPVGREVLALCRASQRRGLLLASGHLEADVELRVDAAQVSPRSRRQGLQPARLARGIP
eukprot:9747987-Alexandrium_andersonii.AAC.1